MCCPTNIQIVFRKSGIAYWFHLVLWRWSRGYYYNVQLFHYSFVNRVTNGWSVAILHCAPTALSLWVSRVGSASSSKPMPLDAARPKKHSPCILCITIKCNRLKLFLVLRILNKFHVTVRHSWKNVTCDMQTLFIWLKLHCFLQKCDCLFNTKGDQRVLQLGYKKLTYYITHAVIFWHILMQLQCIFSTFVLSCLCPKNRISWFDSQTMPQ